MQMAAESQSNYEEERPAGQNTGKPLWKGDEQAYEQDLLEEV